MLSAGKLQERLLGFGYEDTTTTRRRGGNQGRTEDKDGEGRRRSPKRQCTLIAHSRERKGATEETEMREGETRREDPAPLVDADETKHRRERGTGWTNDGERVVVENETRGNEEGGK